MRIFHAALVSVIALTGAAGAAHADYVVWRDPGTGLSLSYPDDWKLVSNADADDLVTVMSPSGRAHGTCRVRAQDDRRHLIYDTRHSAAVQKLDVSQNFWTGYLNEYDDATIDILQDGAGLGRGYASYVEASYWSAVEGPYMPRKAVALASVYNDHLYVAECSAHRDAFAGWRGAFMDVMKSVDFKKAYHETTTGNFRNFLKDRPVLFREPKVGNVHKY